MAIYLDNNATTPLDPAVREVMMHYFDEEYGNAASRTHEYGLRAKRAVQTARRQIADVVAADPGEVIFTSGATEANNLALLGLGPIAAAEGRRHIITTTIEHKAVAEPIDALERQGFYVTRIAVNGSGRVSADAVLAALTPETIAVSVMFANNETGILQPLTEIADGLADHSAYFHVDAAQAFGKVIEPLRHKRVDLISASAHKLFGPKGVGALIARRRGAEAPPLSPLMFGGGHERGLRPGTLPVPLIAAFGEAAARGLAEGPTRERVALARRGRALEAFSAIGVTPIGDQAHVLPHVLMSSFDGVDSEALMLAIKDVAAVSNGSACTSSSYAPSHVLKAMGLPPSVVEGAVRFSWSHQGDEPPWQLIADRISPLRPM